MALKTVNRQLFLCFAELLDYPQPGLIEIALNRCTDLVSGHNRLLPLVQRS